MNLKLIYTIILFYVSFTLYSQVNKSGYPFLTNYTSSDYKSSNENWSVALNKNGILYIGNTSGDILEYDGVSWNRIKTIKNKIIYALATDSNGIVYVGSEGDFGCLLPNKRGELFYQSLASDINDSILNIQTFRQIYVTKKQEVYFCSSKYIYKFSKGKKYSIKLPENSLFTFYIDGHFYISNSDYGLLTIGKNNKLERIKNVEKLRDAFVYLMYKIKKNKIFISTGDRFYFYNPQKSEVTPIENNYFVNDFLLKSFPYVISENNELLFWGTIKSGLAITNSKLNFIQTINDSIGLLHNSISSLLYNPNDYTVWLTSLGGISKVELNPFNRFDANSGLKGIVYNIKRYKGNLYVATDNGLYKQILENNFSKFIKINDISNYITSSLAIISDNDKEVLWIGTEKGLIEFNNEKFKLLLKDVIVESFLQSTNKNIVYLGTQNGLVVAQLKNKQWEFNKIKDLKIFINSIVEDNDSLCWLGSTNNGVYSYNVKKGILRHFTTKDGLPTLNDVYVFKVNNEILFATLFGIYYFDKVNQTFLPYYKFGHRITENKRKVIFATSGYNNQVWLNIDNRLYLLRPHYNKYLIDSISFNKLPEMTIYSLYTEPNGLCWIASSEGVFSYNPNLPFSYKKPICLLRQVKINSIDSVIFGGYNDISLNKLVLAYKHNNLMFSFASPYFVNEKQNEYSYILEGFDEQWSVWSRETKAIYTNIPEGEYVFKVKSRNIYLQESDVFEYKFEIRPPWYRTIWAYISYLIVGIVLIIVIIKLYTRKLEADKIRLEKIVEERTAEIIKQKNEIEEKNKVIEQKNKDITDSIYYAKRIQDSILPSIEVATNANVELGIYFKPKDIVSGDFYFIRNIKQANILIIAAADCTGHGVPGAFMSMLGSSLLNEIVTKPEINHTDLVLNELRNGIIQALNQEGKDTETSDGMDIALIAYDYKNQIIEFSGANNPLYLIRNNELVEYKGDKMPVGLYERKEELFSRTEINVLKNDVLYIFSDGFADQFGGPHGKKYMYKRFKEFLLSIHHLPMNEQAKLLENEIIQWRGEIEQIDDHIVIGIRIL